jgi:excinuclease ABC subunit B
MQRCLDETSRRREIQVQHNLDHGITPTTVSKSADQVRFITRVADARVEEPAGATKKGKRVAEKQAGYEGVDLEALLRMLEKQMKEAAADLDFETAAQLRDQIFELKTRIGAPAAARA